MICETHVFREARSCLMICTAVLNEKCWILDRASSSTPVLDEGWAVLKVKKGQIQILNMGWCMAVLLMLGRAMLHEHGRACCEHARAWEVKHGRA